MKRLLKRLIRERCPRFPTFDKNVKDEVEVVTKRLKLIETIHPRTQERGTAKDDRSRHADYFRLQLQSALLP